MVDRVHQIATALVTHLRRNIRKAAVIPTVNTILSNIHVFRVHDHTEQSAVLNILPSFLAKHSNIRLVILDSVAFHFRHDFQDMAKRSRYAFVCVFLENDDLFFSLYHSKLFITVIKSYIYIILCSWILYFLYFFYRQILLHI